MDRTATIVGVEHLRLEPLPVTVLAGDENVGEKLHLDLDHALPLAGFAPASGDVEREVAGRQSASPGTLGLGEQLADGIEGLQVRDRVRPGRSADGRLIDQHDIGDVLETVELRKLTNAAVPPAFGALDRRVQHIVHERGLPRAAHAGHAGQHAERDLDVDLLQVVLRRSQ